MGCTWQAKRHLARAGDESTTVAKSNLAAIYILQFASLPPPAQSSACSQTLAASACSENTLHAACRVRRAIKPSYLYSSEPWLSCKLCEHGYKVQSCLFLIVAVSAPPTMTHKVSGPGSRRGCVFKQESFIVCSSASVYVISRLHNTYISLLSLPALSGLLSILLPPPPP